MSEETKFDEACASDSLESPQPSTSASAASTPSATSAPLPPDSVPSTSAASTPSGCAPKRISVYSHIEGIQEIGQLRGLRSGRRRARFRGMRKTTTTLKREQALNILEPIFREESQRLEEAQTLVAAAIEHFANTVCGLVDCLEAERAERERADDAGQKPEAKRAKRSSQQERPAEAEAEAAARRLECEALAAVAALSSGDERGERLPALVRLVDSLSAHFQSGDDTDCSDED